MASTRAIESTPHRAPRALLVIAVVSWTLAAAMLIDAIAPWRGRGMIERSFTARDGRCVGFEPPVARSRAVREPVLLPGRARSCVSWSSTFIARQSARYRVEVETDRALVMRVDGADALTVATGDVALHVIEIDVARGVHPIEIALTEPAGSSPYLRLRVLDLDGARPWGVPPLDLDEWRTDAPSSLAAVPAPRGAARTVLFTALVLAGAIALLLRRRGAPTWREVPKPLLDALVVLTLASLYLVPRAVAAGYSIDELAYVKAGQNYVANLLIGDFETRAWRWNMEHPPVAKWVYGWAALLGGFEGARAAAAMAGAMTIALTTTVGNVVASRRVGWLAAALLASTPHFVGLVRTCTLEAVTLVIWAALLVVLAAWLREPRVGAPRERALRFFAGALPVLGTFARATSVWSGVLAFAVSLLVARRRRVGGVWIPWEMIAGAVVTVVIVYAGWPWLWPDPRAQFGEAVRHFTDYVPYEFYRGELVHPGRDYFTHAFLATTPELHLLCGALGALYLSRRSPAMGALLTLALLLPFAQSISHVRQDLSRYVVPAWIGLALLGACALDALGDRIAPRVRHPRAARVAIALPVIVAGLVGLALAEPYPRTFFAWWTGGARAVAEERRFEVADWCEGLEDATDFVDAHAEDGDRVEYRTSCRDLHRALRDGLIEHRGGARGWIIAQRTAYELDQRTPEIRCPVAHETWSSGVVVARVWDCR